ncbi:ABC transporter substrate-binding protein [Vibrio agarilyticus]|nr:ABC transporter substrate-binding protein [Vibrio agarilyticus]
MLCVSSLFLASTSFAATVDKTNPEVMMKQVAQQTFARLKADQAQIRQNPNLLKTIVEQELMPYVNYKYAALKVLGTNLKGADRSEVGTFINAFRDYLISAYAQVLTQYTDQQVEFAPMAKLDPNKRITSVKVTIIDAPRPNISLEFKLRKEKNGDWLAFDMVAEGISLLSSKQSEWNGEIRQKGILAVAKTLEQQAAQPIKFESKD